MIRSGEGEKSGAISPLGFAADVARQDDRYVAPDDLEHDRVVVADVLTLPVGEGRMPQQNLHAIDCDQVVRLNIRPGGADSLGGALEGTKSLVRRNRNPFPHVGGPEFSQDRVRATDVIDIAVRERDRIEPADAAVPEHGRDDSIADIERGGAGQAAGIDEQRRAIRKPHERGIALPDIDEGDVQTAVAR